MMLGGTVLVVKVTAATTVPCRAAAQGRTTRCRARQAQQHCGIVPPRSLAIMHANCTPENIDGLVVVFDQVAGLARPC